MNSEYPLIQRLIDDMQFPVATPDNLDELIANNDTLILFFPSNPNRYPESNDVAIILPELLKDFNGELSAALVLEEHEDELKQRYPFDLWPALVFIKQGFHIGNICKMQDWIDYLTDIKALLSKNDHLQQTIPTQTLSQEA